MAIGSRLRLLTDRITADAADIYRLYGNDFKPKWFPVFFVLAGGEAKTVTSIAHEIGHSHPSVSNIVKEMKARGLIAGDTERSDGRCNLVRLSGRDLKWPPPSRRHAPTWKRPSRVSVGKQRTTCGEQSTNGNTFWGRNPCWNV